MATLQTTNGTGSRSANQSRTLRSISRAVRRQRKPLALIAFAIAVALALHLVSPRAPRLASVVVPKHDLAAGHVITAADLEHAEFNPGSLPDGLATNEAELIAQMVGTNLTAGLPISRSVIHHNVNALSPGEAALALPLDGPGLLEILHPGSLVKMVFPPGSPAETISSCNEPATVLSTNAVVNGPKDSSLVATNQSNSNLIVKITLDCAEHLAFIPDMSMIRLVLVPDTKTPVSYP